MIRQSFRGACGLALLAVVGPVAGRAETSSWQQRITPAPAATRQPKLRSPDQGDAKEIKVRSRAVQPSESPKGALGKAAAGKATSPRPLLGPATMPISADAATKSGTDPAYDAFDQGRYLTALSIATRLAKDGDPQAHTLIARIHAEGLGVPLDAKQAAQWYERGVELGDPEAALGLGTLYARGEGVGQDYGKAAELYEKAASKGHAESNYNLALLFLSGKGKGENPRRGFALMQYAADKGVTAAMYDLGTLHATGVGTDPNAFEAAKWIGKAANAGHLAAEIDYALVLLKDHALPAEQKTKLQQRAMELLRSAAAKGSAVAQNRLAHCHLAGLGTPKDPLQAAKWHYIAQAGGRDDPVLEKAAGSLARADRSKAQAAAAEWREQTFLE